MNNGEISDSVEIANNFNEYFIFVAEKLADNMNRNLIIQKWKAYANNIITKN